MPAPVVTSSPLPLPNQAADWKEWANALVSTLEIRFSTAGGSSVSVAPILYDNLGRIILDSDGHYVYGPTGESVVDANVVAINTAHLVDAAITTSKLGAASVSTAKLADLAVEAAKLADAAVSTAKIADLAISNGKLADLVVDAAKLATAAVTSTKIANLAVGTAAIADAAITTVKIADAQITSAKIANLAVGTAAIAAAAVGTAQIANLAVTSALVADAAIVTAKINDLAVTTAKINNLAVTTAKIANLAVDTAQINSAAVTSAKIASATIVSANIASATITGANIASATIAAANIVDATITGAKIASATIAAANIVDATITGAKIASATIATANIASAAITTALIGDAQVTNAKIVALDAAKITTGSLDAARIAAGTITVEKLTVGFSPSDNLVIDPAFEDYSVPWAATAVTVTRTSVTDSPVGRYVLSCVGTADANLFAPAAHKIPVDTNRVYMVEAWIRWVGGATQPRMYIGLVPQDRDGVTIPATPTSDTYIYCAASNVLTPASFTKYTGFVTGEQLTANVNKFRVGTKFVRPVLLINRSVGGVSTTTEIAGFRVTSVTLGTDTVDTAHIKSAAITTAKIGAAQITTALIADANITTAKILDANITTAKIASANITTALIADANITGAKIALATITAANITDATITGAKIASATIAAANIVDATITGAKIASATITDANIASATITSAKIASLDAAKITTGTLDAARIAAGSLTTNKLVVGSFDNLATDGSFESAALSTYNVVHNGGTWTIGATNPRSGLNALIYNPSGQVGAAEALFYHPTSGSHKGVTLAVNRVLYGECYARCANVASANRVRLEIVWLNGAGGVVSTSTGTLITPTTTYAVFTISATAPATAVAAAMRIWVVADGFTTNTLYFDDAYSRFVIGTAIIEDAAITTAKILDANITTAKIADANITTAKIASANITTALIADANITGAKIASATIAAANIIDATITGAKIASATIAAANIVDATITGAKIAAATITAANIVDATITTAKIGDAQVTNAKIASLDVAKLTAGAIGAVDITIASGGNIRSGQTAFNTGTGFFLGTPGGTPKFSIGDGVNEGFGFDGTALFILPHTALQGSDAYHNNSIFWHTFFDSLDGFTVTGTNGGAVTLSASAVILGKDTTSLNGLASLIKTPLYPMTAYTWDKPRKFKARVNIACTDMNHTRAVFAIGNILTPVSTGRHFGFYLDETMGLVGTVADGTTQATTALMTLVSGTTYLLEAILTPGGNVEFFVDGVSKGTISTNLPTGTTDSGQVFKVRVSTDGVAAGAAAFTWGMSEYAFLQQP